MKDEGSRLVAFIAFSVESALRPTFYVDFDQFLVWRAKF